MGKGELLMWTYDKMLEHPVNIKNRNPMLAKFIISQYGGPDGELAASLRYLSQRFGSKIYYSSGTHYSVRIYYDQFLLLDPIGFRQLYKVRSICFINFSETVKVFFKIFAFWI